MNDIIKNIKSSEQMQNIRNAILDLIQAYDLSQIKIEINQKTMAEKKIKQKIEALQDEKIDLINHQSFYMAINTALDSIENKTTEEFIIHQIVVEEFCKKINELQT